MSPNVRAVGFVLFRHYLNEIQFLLLQTSYGEHHWTPPKGHVDPGENDLQTAYRETEEEAGIKPSDIKILNFEKILNYTAHGKPKTVVYKLAEVIDPNLSVTLSDEHQAYDWLPLDNAVNTVGYSDLQQLLRDCYEFINNIKKDSVT